jgi:hypothetical protein
VAPLLAVHVSDWVEVEQPVLALVQEEPPCETMTFVGAAGAIPLMPPNGRALALRLRQQSSTGMTIFI